MLGSFRLALTPKYRLPDPMSIESGLRSQSEPPYSIVIHPSEAHLAGEGFELVHRNKQLGVLIQDTADILRISLSHAPADVVLQVWGVNAVQGTSHLLFTSKRRLLELPQEEMLRSFQLGGFTHIDICIAPASEVGNEPPLPLAMEASDKNRAADPPLPKCPDGMTSVTHQYLWKVALKFRGRGPFNVARFMDALPPSSTTTRSTASGWLANMAKEGAIYSNDKKTHGREYSFRKEDL